jgi:Protein of unknown function (DUF3485)
MRRFLSWVLALTVVIGTGVVHGFWTDRWGVGEKIQRAVDSLDEVPRQLGDWEGTELKTTGRELQDVPGQLSIQYVNRKTGDAIRLDLICGRAGPVSIHTPDVCYAASGFRVGKRIDYELKGENITGSPHFYTSDMSQQNTAADANPKRLFWSWRTRQGWQVAENPRIQFAGQSVVYKFYLSRDLSAPVPVGDDPCIRFLRLLLPELEKIFADTV